MSMLNTQKPSALLTLVTTLQVHSIFSTIQGEGTFAGTPAIFVRLYGCNLQCPRCDTDYTSNLSPMTPAEVVRAVVKLNAPRSRWSMGQRPLVVITGGEPFRQAALSLLVEELEHAGFQSQIETNGTLWIEDFPFLNTWIICSPKTPRINAELAMAADAFKYVLDADHVDKEDGLPCGTLGAYEKTARPPAGDGWTGDVFVQPLDEQDHEKNVRNMNACVASCRKYGYRLCIQTHKIANLP